MKRRLLLKEKHRLALKLIEFKSSNMTYFKNENLVSSKEKSSLIDKNSQLYTFSKFNYSMNETLLKAENITITTNYNTPASDKFFFSSCIFNLDRNQFVAADTEIEIHKNIFSNNENDPRIFYMLSKEIVKIFF